MLYSAISKITQLNIIESIVNHVCAKVTKTLLLTLSPELVSLEESDELRSVLGPS